MAASSPPTWHDPQVDLPAVVVVATHIAPAVPEVPAVCAQFSAITPEGRPVTRERRVVAGPAVLPAPRVITLDVPPITSNILAVLTYVPPVMAHTLIQLPAVLSTRAWDPQCHGH